MAKKKKTLPKLKFDLQKIFNKFIRLRDAEGDYFTCIACGETKPKEVTNAGHFYAVKGYDSMRFNEDKFIKEVEKYIKGTYDQHYVGKKEVQTIDVWETLGSIDTTCRDTAIKYLMRYGKKGGHNRKDLLKAVHYIVLLAHFTEGDSNGN